MLSIDELMEKHTVGLLSRKDFSQLLLVLINSNAIDDIWLKLEDKTQKRLLDIARYGPWNDMEWDSLIWSDTVEHAITENPAPSALNVLKNGLAELRRFLKIKTPFKKLREHFQPYFAKYKDNQTGSTIHLSPTTMDLNWDNEVTFEEMAGDPSVVIQRKNQESFAFQRIAGEIRYYMSFLTENAEFPVEEMGTVKTLSQLDELLSADLSQIDSFEKLNVERKLLEL